MRVAVEVLEDVPAWLALAAEVEPLFGPLVAEPTFRRALDRNIARGSAYCVRDGGGPPGSPLLGGLLLSVHPPEYRIGWLSVAATSRRRGVGKLLVERVFDLADRPARLSVVTFGEGVAGGEPARRFYERLGLHPAEMTEPGPDGGERQIYRRDLS
jgi:GNAT superfamily N-acetyltransferase